MSALRATSDELPPEYRVLVDAPEDGYIEERGWVPVAFAPTPEDAIRIAYAEEVVGDFNSLRLVVTGRSWHRRDPAVRALDGTAWYVAEEEPCEQCSGSGKAPEPECAYADGACDRCWGVGRSGYVSDYEPWAKCEPTDEGAVEWWNLELTHA